jgi:hypothetical protein
MSPPPPAPPASVAKLRALGYTAGTADSVAQPVMVPDQTLNPMNTEEYGRIAENSFLDAARNPLSTFSIDVDRASYSNVRRGAHRGDGELFHL